MNYKQFIDFVNKEFKRLEVTDYIAIKAERTYHRNCDYEAGACKMLVWFEHKDKSPNNILKHYFMCDYFLKEYNYYLKNGYELYLTMRYRTRIDVLTNLEVRVRKISNPQKQD